MVAMISHPMGGRSIEEWIAKHPDQKIPDYVRDRVFLRAGGRCYLTNRKLMPGEWDLDHVKRLADGGEHRESNLAPIWRARHRVKTAEENSDAAKADRIRRKNNGTWPKSKAQIRAGGFRKTRDV
jgi:5-methylcytosine-specific restriction endonuclease McrA